MLDPQAVKNLHVLLDICSLFHGVFLESALGNGIYFSIRVFEIMIRSLG